MNPDFQFSFGAEPSKEDSRTISHGDLALAVAPPSTFEIDYAGYLHKNQQKVGICTAACVTTLAERFFGTTWRGSMEWLYKLGKVLIDGNTTEGSSIFTMMKAAQKYGIPSESKFPSNCNRTYEEFIADMNITQEILDDAALHKIPGYAQVSVDPDSLMKAVSTSKCGIATREAVGNELWTDMNGNWTNDPAKLEPWRTTKTIVSGHAIGMIKYDATADFKGKKRNSWGDAWCNKGDIEFYLKTRAPFFTEAWTIVDKVLFAKDLRMGQTSDDVQRLQIFLNTHGYKVSDVGPGSPGQESTYFGFLTFHALKSFQAANSIPSTGYFGPLTRAKVNQM